MTQPAPPPPPPSQSAGPPPGHYRATDGRDYPIPAGYYLASDGQLYPNPNATPTPPSAGVALASGGGWRWDAASIMLVVGAAVVAVAAFLPWATVAGFFTKNGIDGDGTITLVLAAAAAALGAGGILKASKGMLIGSIVSASLIVVIAIIDMADVSSGPDVGFDIDVTIGIGLYLTLLGGVVAAVGAILALRSR